MQHHKDICKFDILSVKGLHTFFLYYNSRENMNIGALSSKLKVLTTDREFKAAMYIVTSKSNSSFGTIAKAKGVKMTAKAVGKNSNFCFSMKNN